MKKVKLEINGINYEDFISINVERSLDSFCGVFSFESSGNQEFIIEGNDICRIYLDDNLVLTGYVEIMNPNISSDDHIISFSGRDVVCDIIDSSLPSGINIEKGISLEKIIDKVLTGLGIRANINNYVSGLSSFSDTELISAEPDDNTYNFIRQYTDKRSVLMTSDPKGNINLIRGFIERVPDRLFLKYNDDEGLNNIKSAKADYNYANRFYKYTVISQENKLADNASFNENSVNIKGIAYDKKVRTSRNLTIISNKVSDSATCQEIAEMEANIRRAKCFTYNCVVAGFTRNDGNLWMPAQLVSVYDEVNSVNMDMVINKCVYISNPSARETIMTLVPVDAYTLEANLDEIISRSNSIAKSKSKKTKGLSQVEISKINDFMSDVYGE